MMDITDRWEKALKKTEIIRSRVQALSTFEATELPYIFLAESSVNIGDSVVRKGKILVEKPNIIMPENLPFLEGFDFDKVQKLKEFTKNKITVAGGITTIEDIKKLEKLGCNSQIGMALYTGKIDLKEAFQQTF